MSVFRGGLTVLTLCIAMFLGITAAAQDRPAEAGFVPTWKLLKGDERRQFVAGYMYGWKDAARVIEIVRDFVRQNPKDAAAGLEKIQALYDLSGLKVDTMVNGLDAFFADPANGDASFSQAITAVRGQIPR